MKRALLLNLAIPLLGLPDLATSEETQRTDVLQTTERIRSEERRQGDVRRQLSGSVRKIDRLLRDLESNGLTDKGQGSIIGEMSAALTKVNATRVPQAVRDLQKARLENDQQRKGSQFRWQRLVCVARLGQPSHTLKYISANTVDVKINRLLFIVLNVIYKTLCSFNVCANT